MHPAGAKQTDLVSVVIPAHNAAATLQHTLLSVRAQTYGNLEIIVVDDGSTDATQAIASDNRRRDRRITVLQQPNGGVASARNRGIASCTGEYIAFVDADDLWAPQKIEKQMALVARSANPRAANYTHFAMVDAAGWTTNSPVQSASYSDPLAALCRENIIGNGSALLVHRDLVAQVGRFDESLRARHAQGCEDLDFYIRLAERTSIATLPEPLTGYRQHNGAMSADRLQMLRSRILVDRATEARLPGMKRHLDEGRMDYAMWLLIRTLARRDLITVMKVVAIHGPGRPLLCWRVAKRLTGELFALARGTRPQAALPHRFPVGEAIDDPL